ncbi:DNA repair exonuclease [Paenibacillus sp. JCM 10914]|uniref:metallophosphoesterase family protein n=1 Tax=Paenibacillus sp. JCM 10914 TaxID=1236974 RepID=UPI001E2E98E9|nr:DNA repair exonuclease [Paenibacillus sp. JCM 10914]
MEQHVDFVVISGDVYDSSNISLRAQLRFMDSLRRLGESGIAVYVIHGNHDPLDSVRLAVKLPDHVHVFGGEPSSITAVRRIDGEAVAVISGMSYPTSKVVENIAVHYPAPTPGLYHIGLLHANVDGDPQHETYAPCSRNELVSYGYHYWALGHVHTRRLVHEEPFIVYPGNIQGRHIREQGPKGCYVVDVDDDLNTELLFHELDSMRWTEVVVPVDHCTEVDEWRIALEQQVEAISQDNPEMLSVIRVKITGRSLIHHQLEDGHVLDDLLMELRRREVARGAAVGFQGCVWIESFSLQSGTVVDMEKLLAEDSFTGDLLRLARMERARLIEAENVVKSSLAPLMEHGEIRDILQELEPDELLEWLRRAEEMTLRLLLGESSQKEGAGI